VTAELQTDQSGAVLTVRFSNPPHNFFDAAAVDGLYELVRRIERDASVAVVVLCGTPEFGWFTHFDPKVILAGLRGGGLRVTTRQGRAVLALLHALRRLPRVERTLRRSRIAGLVTMARLEEVYETVEASGTIYVAAIDGTVFGAGLALALACDVRLAADTDRPIGLPEPVLGFVPPTAVTRLVRTLGAGQSARFLLRGEWASPREAVELGLVHRVVPRDELELEAHAEAEAMARRSPALVRELKRVVYDGGSSRLAAALRLERAAFLATSGTSFAARALELLVADVQAHPGEDGLQQAWRRAREREVD